MSDFNIFKILSKDDKELIHSAFLRFMLGNSMTVATKILGISPSEIKNIVLESGKNYKRLDIKIHHLGDEIVYVVENKFKSFPDEQQLKEYDELIATSHPGSKCVKILICFDKSTISFDHREWNPISYEEIANFVESINSHEFDGDKLVFVQHYYNFLKEYIDYYATLKTNCYSIFKNEKNSDNKFWLRLIMNSVINYIKVNITDENYQYHSTKVPLWNIIPKKWENNGIEILIQFQGADVKLYTHTSDKDFVRIAVKRVQSKMGPSKGKFNLVNRKESESHFIYTEKLIDFIPENNFTVQKIAEFIYDFYLRIDTALSSKD